MSLRKYLHVGGGFESGDESPRCRRTRIAEMESLRDYLAATEEDVSTFIVDTAGVLWLADRGLTHAAVARGFPVLAAGEIAFDRNTRTSDISYSSNHSTSYCPELASWDGLVLALDRASLPTEMNSYSAKFIFRRCESCNTINIVKEQVFECECGSHLPDHWNLASSCPHDANTLITISLEPPEQAPLGLAERFKASLGCHNDVEEIQSMLTSPWYSHVIEHLRPEGLDSQCSKLDALGLSYVCNANEDAP